MTLIVPNSKRSDVYHYIFSVSISISREVVDLMAIEKIILKKCKSCPYHLGLIKCVKSPCPECRLSKSSRRPFPEFEIIYNKSIFKKL